MTTLQDTTEPGDPPYVSTGHLPSPAQVQRVVDEAHARYGTVARGENSRVYPALTDVDGDLFGISVAGITGNVYTAGDTDHPFTIMSVAKPFVFALVCQAIGTDEARRRLGVNATGLPFNSFAAVERSEDGTTNPMVNAGAIAATSLAPGAAPDAKWQFVHDGLSRFAGRELAVDERVYASASETNHVNRGIANLLAGRRRIYCDPAEALDLYTRQSALAVTATDLAVMGATLADGGVNPRTRARVVDEAACHAALAVMATAGLYETSGDWLYDVGMPGKSGIGGGMVTISPGKGGLGTFAPPLDAAGNSVRGQLVARSLSRRLGLSLFLSRPEAWTERSDDE
jgi:glutaminase